MHLHFGGISEMANRVYVSLFNPGAFEYEPVKKAANI